MACRLSSGVCSRRLTPAARFLVKKKKQHSGFLPVGSSSLESIRIPRPPVGYKKAPSNRDRNLGLRLLSSPKRDGASRTQWASSGHEAWLIGGFSISTTTALAQGRRERDGGSLACSSHGKEVYRDYSVTGIPGDGRCLFRSVIHGASIRLGKPIPDESLQTQLADELRIQVADEFIRRRTETEWFIEGDFDAYVSHMRKPHVWGGEPELLMASHVLQMPITVYMLDKDSGGLIEIAEYGQEYGKEDPIRVLYHGFGHYDAVHIPPRKDIRSRL